MYILALKRVFSAPIVTKKRFGDVIIFWYASHVDIMYSIFWIVLDVAVWSPYVFKKSYSLVAEWRANCLCNFQSCIVTYNDCSCAFNDAFRFSLFHINFRLHLFSYVNVTVLWWHDSISVLLRHQQIGVINQGCRGLISQVHWHLLHQEILVYLVRIKVLVTTAQPFPSTWLPYLQIESLY